MGIFAKKYGLHPLVALAVVCIDTMLFGSDLLSFETYGVTLAVSVGVAAFLTVPCILLQKYAYKDIWWVAIAKGLIVGLLTGIPTSLPSIATGAGGVLGVVGLMTQRKSPRRRHARSKKMSTPSRSSATGKPQRSTTSRKS